MNAVIFKMRSRWSSMSLESWKLLFEVIGLLAVGATFMFGSAALVVGNRINKHQASQLRQFDEDLTAAKTELGKQQERAANADARVAGLERDAANAKVTQQKVEIELARQREKTAIAERALLELQQKLADRNITSQHRDKMLAVLRTRAPGHVVVQSLLSGGREALQYASEIAAVFRAAGWDVTPPTGMGSFKEP